MRYYYEWWKHRLTCFKCHPSHITGMNRAQRGKARTGDALVMFLITMLILFAVGALMGYLLKGG